MRRVAGTRETESEPRRRAGSRAAAADSPSDDRRPERSLAAAGPTVSSRTAACTGVRQWTRRRGPHV